MATTPAFKTTHSHSNRSATETALPVQPPPDAVVSSVPQTHFSFKDYLTAAEAAQFFEFPHRAQVDKVAQYLDFLGEQPMAAHFTASSKASVSFAALRASRPWYRERLRAAASADPVRSNTMPNSSSAGTIFAGCDTSSQSDATQLLHELLDGRTRSGFGAFGTEDGYLPQKPLSLAVANAVEAIGHEYVVEHTKRGAVRAPVLNSRSFFFYWCHAEKQKLLDIRLKLDRLNSGDQQQQHVRRALWHELIVVVDRPMCLDCIGFAACFARAEQIDLMIEDPDALRVFPCDAAQQVQCFPLHEGTE